MSTPIEIEQLQKEKARLEEEACDLDEELKQLETRWKVLTEKIAIQELKNSNAAKQEAISQLQSKISLLETQLEKLSTDSTLKIEAAPTAENTEKQEVRKGEVDVSEEETEKDDDTIRVTALDNEEEINENCKVEREKKKHGFFYY